MTWGSEIIFARLYINRDISCYVYREYMYQFKYTNTRYLYIDNHKILSIARIIFVRLYINRDISCYVYRECMYKFKCTNM